MKHRLVFMLFLVAVFVLAIAGPALAAPAPAMNGHVGFTMNPTESYAQRFNLDFKATGDLSGADGHIRLEKLSEDWFWVYEVQHSYRLDSNRAACYGMLVETNVPEWSPLVNGIVVWAQDKAKGIAAVDRIAFNQTPLSYDEMWLTGFGFPWDDGFGPATPWDVQKGNLTVH